MLDFLRVSCMATLLWVYNTIIKINVFTVAFNASFLNKNHYFTIHMICTILIFTVALLAAWHFKREVLWQCSLPKQIICLWISSENQSEWFGYKSDLSISMTSLTQTPTQVFVLFFNFLLLHRFGLYRWINNGAVIIFMVELFKMIETILAVKTSSTI